MRGFIVNSALALAVTLWTGSAQALTRWRLRLLRARQRRRL
jgi:hypothetical protein